MLKLRYKPWIAVCLTTLLAACGGSGKDKTTPTPNAAISALQTTVEVGQIVQLDGSASRSPNNGYLTYQWSIQQKPRLSTAEILQQDQPTTTFHADIPGTYVVSLNVLNEGKVLSAPASMTIQATSTLPVAVAEKEAFRLINKKIELDGSNSTAPDGKSARSLTYAWVLSAPSGIPTPPLTDANTAWPSFTATSEGMYMATLTVTHEGKASKPLKTYIIATQGNAAPNARITVESPSNGQFERGQPITLSAATSDDDDGDELHYRWRFGGQPYGTPTPLDSKTALSTPHTETTTFTPDLAGTYWVELDAFDGTITTTTKQSFNVTSPSNATSQLPKILGMSVGKTASTATGILEMEIGEPYYLFVDAYDPDGGFPGYQWEVQEPPAGWRVKNKKDFTNDTFQALVNQRTGKPYGGTSTWPAVGSPSVGNDGGFALVPPSDFQYRNPIDLKVKVTVYDAQNTDPTATGNKVERTFTLRLMTGANLKPTAYAGTNFKQVLVGSEVLLNGNFDDDNGNAIADWQWTLLEAPFDSQAQIINPKAQNTSFIADKVGDYRVGLVVTDTLGAKSDAPFGILQKDASTIISAKPFSGGNHTPTARFTGIDTLKTPPTTNHGSIVDIPFDDDEQVYHYQLGSIKNTGCTTWSHTQASCEDNVRIHFKTYDPDGDELIYDVLLEQPHGANYQHSYTEKITSKDGTNHLSFMSLQVPGDYKMTLQALDGIAVSAPQELTLRVENYPANYTAFKVHYCYDSLKTSLCSLDTNKPEPSNVTFLPMKGFGSVGGNNPRDRYEYFLNGGTVNYYLLEAIGQDYTIESVKILISDIIADQEGLAYKEAENMTEPVNNAFKAHTASFTIPPLSK